MTGETQKPEGIDANEVTEALGVTDAQGCPSCGAALDPGALFCEACGVKLGGDAAPGPLDVPEVAHDEDAPISAPTAVRPPGESNVATSGVRECAECGGAVGDDGYCEQCGVKAPSPRDHFREQPAAWVAGVCDRGIVHSRNEDAMALWADGQRAVLVVCDGVSSSTDSDVASLAGAKAARDVLRAPMPQGLGVPESAEAAAVKVFNAAAEAANSAVIAHTAAGSASPASCTFVCAVIEPGLLRYAVIGDSRAYWFPDGGTPEQLTTDDSMAALMMAGGTSREEAETSPQAHAITKWLGKDSPDIVPVTGSRALAAPGWVLVCSDGLWNYASAPEALEEQLRVAIQQEGATSEEPDPMPVALALLAFAKNCGGRDNITVTLARVKPA